MKLVNVTTYEFRLFEFLHYHGLRMVEHASSYQGLFFIFFAIVFRVVSKCVTDEGLFQEIIKVRERESPI